MIAAALDGLKTLGTLIWELVSALLHAEYVRDLVDALLNADPDQEPGLFKALAVAITD